MILTVAAASADFTIYSKVETEIQSDDCFIFQSSRLPQLMKLTFTQVLELLKSFAEPQWLKLPMFPTSCFQVKWRNRLKINTQKHQNIDEISSFSRFDKVYTKWIGVASGERQK